MSDKTVIIGAGVRGLSTASFASARLVEQYRIVIGAGFSGHGFKFSPLFERFSANMSVKGLKTVYKGSKTFSCQP